MGNIDFMRNYLKKMLPKSLFLRFILILIAPVILSQSIIGIMFFEKYTQTILGIISTRMAGEACAITRLLDMNCEKEYIDELKQSMNVNVEILNDAKLKKRGIAKNHQAYRALRRATQKKGFTNYYIDTEDQNMNIYIPSCKNPEIYKISFLRKTLYVKIIAIVLGSGIVSSIVFLLIAFIFLKNQIRPIRKLAEAMTEFGKGLNTEYKPEGALEIREAGTAFCQMKSKINELMNTRMQVLAGISHDLRTPLTKMKLQLSLMPQTKETEWLSSDVDMMIRMTESFTLHAFEQNKEISVFKNIYLLIEEIVRDYISDDFAVDISGDKNTGAAIKYISLKRAFGNIISNAKKHAEHLYINIKVSSDYVVITFEDNGCGIDEDNADSLFLPFTTENEARTHNVDKGVGLGLSIARDVINAHGGSIKATNSLNYPGACFTVTLPHTGAI